MFKTLFALSLVAFATAECPNACSGHGSCGNFDMCTCYRNWQAADCSQRTCPFDRAHVDTPKGDLDFSNTAISGNSVVTVGSTVYPYGTIESSWKASTTDAWTKNTAHNYMECSNKGLCDRTTGECDCFGGYDGAACQRASCPNDCSGHGTCQSIQQISAATFSNVYALWDKKATMGCVCDASYTAADCSQRQCKYGVDPLYIDDTYARNTKVTITVAGTTIVGNIAIKFYDVFGEDYTTNFFSAMPTKTGTDYTDTERGAQLCVLVKAALVALPNKAVPAVDCYGPSTLATAATTWSVTLDFTSNPGYLKMPEVVTSVGGVAQLTTGTAVVSTVEIGEFTDYFATVCASLGAVKLGVTVTPSPAAGANSAVFNSAGTALVAGIPLLKKCLADSDGDATNNVAIENWDIPAPATYIHVAKAVQTAISSGSFRRIENILITTDAFLLANNPVDYTQTYKIFTTDGTAKKVLAGRIITAVNGFTVTTQLDVSCETVASSNAEFGNCVKVGSRLFIVKNAVTTDSGQGQLFTVVKISTRTSTTAVPFATGTADIKYNVITLDYSIGQADVGGGTSDGVTAATTFIYQFAPATTGNYAYVSQCSNRGSCDSESGLCTCFKGYTKDDCSTQSALAM